MQFIFSALLFLPLISFADLSGKFQGRGKAVFSETKTYNCKEIFLQLKHSVDQLHIPAGGYICEGGLQAGFDPFTLKIKDGHLFYGEDRVGSITDTGLNISVYDPNDDSTYNLTLKKSSEGVLSYDETWFVGIEEELRVTGQLKQLAGKPE